ncbi:MAG: MBL fold metallo-hydrolase [Alphaproteobacteria bacterium]
MADPEIVVRFWGVRDHIAVPGPETAGYGGNTPCIEVRCGNALLIFDSGTGIRPLGQRLLREGPIQGDIFFTHAQFDRISGLPFFAAAFSPTNAFRLWAGLGDGVPGIEAVLRRLMTDPIFPVPIDVMRARLEFHDFVTGNALRPATDVVVRTHGFGAARRVTGYRVEHAGRAVCYVTDVASSDSASTAAIARFIAGADLAILGADTETSDGASRTERSWRWAVGVGEAAGVRQLVLSNHAHDDGDVVLDRLAGLLARSHPLATLAREGLEIAV